MHQASPAGRPDKWHGQAVIGSTAVLRLADTEAAGSVFFGLFNPFFLEFSGLLPGLLGEF